MDLKKLNNILGKKFSGSVKATIENGCVLLTGKVKTYQDKLDAGFLAVDKKRYIGVLNDIENEDKIEEKIRIPSINDKALDNKKVDVLVIGGGVSGASILRELTKYNLSCLLVEKENDLAMHASSRNNGEVHPGVDLSPGTMKHDLVLKGNAAYDQIAKELSVPFKRIGQFALFDQAWLYPIIAILAKIRTKQGCPTQVVGKKFIYEKDPTYNKGHLFALYNPQAGLVCPYELTIAYGENAIENGAEISLNTYVTGMKLKDNEIISVSTNRGIIYPKIVINAAGVFAEEIAKMANDRYFSIHPRKGTILILDKKAGFLTNTTSAVKKVMAHENHSKGGGLSRSCDLNVLVGPSAWEQQYKEDFSTRSNDVDQIVNKHKQTNESLNKGQVITYFAGIRASTYEEDFYIHEGRNTKNIYHVAGIQSPGLTTAPVVAKDVSFAVAKMLGKENDLNKTYNPYRKVKPVLNNLSYEERDKLIKQNKDYGIIICRCEEISKGEIIDQLRNPLTPPTIDAIKRRCRPGMGRCQGGFCMPLVANIICEERNLTYDQVMKNSLDSKISYGPSKEGK